MLLIIATHDVDALHKLAALGACTLSYLRGLLDD